MTRAKGNSAARRDIQRTVQARQASIEGRHAGRGHLARQLARGWEAGQRERIRSIADELGEYELVKLIDQINEEERRSASTASRRSRNAAAD